MSVNNKQRLSQLMKVGATKLAPHTHCYFDSNVHPLSACALGCAIYAAGAFKAHQNVSIFNLPSEVQETLDVLINVADLPDDVRQIEWMGSVPVRRLATIISATNDQISRDRAIEVTELLGY